MQLSIYSTMRGCCDLLACANKSVSLHTGPCRVVREAVKVIPCKETPCSKLSRLTGRFQVTRRCPGKPPHRCVGQLVALVGAVGSLRSGPGGAAPDTTTKQTRPSGCRDPALRDRASLTHSGNVFLLNISSNIATHSTACYLRSYPLLFGTKTSQL